MWLERDPLHRPHRTHAQSDPGNATVKRTGQRVVCRRLAPEMPRWPRVAPSPRPRRSHYCLQRRAHDGICIFDAPNEINAGAVSVAVGGTGTYKQLETRGLLTPRTNLRSFSRRRVPAGADIGPRRGRWPLDRRRRRATQTIVEAVREDRSERRLTRRRYRRRRMRDVECPLRRGAFVRKRRRACAA
jgi:hypothetical protein